MNCSVELLFLHAFSVSCVSCVACVQLRESAAAMEAARIRGHNEAIANAVIDREADIWRRAKVCTRENVLCLLRVVVVVVLCETRS